MQKIANDYGMGGFNAFLLAFILYAVLVFFVLFQFSKDEILALKYTDTPEAFIDVDLGEFNALKPEITHTPSPPAPPIETPTPETEESKETTNQPVKTEEIEQKQSNIDELFGNVKEYQEEKSTKVQSSAKSTPKARPKMQNQVQNLFQSIDTNLKQETSKGQAQESQKTGIYDEFRGKIRRFLEDRWRLYEASGNFKVMLDFYVDSNGNFGYTSVSKSYDSAFDAKVDEFLRAQSGKFVAYPPNQKPYHGKAELSDKINVGELQ